MDYGRRDDRAGPDSAGHTAHDTVRIEVSLPGEPDPKVLELLLVDDVLDAARQALVLDILIFALDGDEPLAKAPPGRKALRLTVHTGREITVMVNYEHLTKEKKFSPSKTVFKVLQWAVGKSGFNLDPTSAARATRSPPGQLLAASLRLRSAASSRRATCPGAVDSLTRRRTSPMADGSGHRGRADACRHLAGVRFQAGVEEGRCAFSATPSRSYRRGHRP